MIPVVGAVADARDAVQALIKGDILGAALNAAGAIPGPGDGAKVANVVGLFIRKNPDKIIETAIIMMKVFKKFAPTEVNLDSLDKLFDGAATALKNKGISISIIEELGENGRDLLKLNEALDDAVKLPRVGNVDDGDIYHIVLNKKITIEKTLGFIKSSDGSVHWLENGLTDAEALAAGLQTGGRGWRHIFNDHLNDFIKFGASSEEDVQKLLWETIENGVKKEIDDGYGRKGSQYVHQIGGEKLRAFVSSNGYIVSFYPI